LKTRKPSNSKKKIGAELESENIFIINENEISVEQEI
jgi:hypothetical protein